MLSWGRGSGMQGTGDFWALCEVTQHCRAGQIELSAPPLPSGRHLVGLQLLKLMGALNVQSRLWSLL